MLKDMLQQGDFLTKIDLMDACISKCSNLDPSPKIVALRVPKCNMGVSLPPLWARKCSSDIYQVAQTSSFTTAKKGGIRLINYLDDIVIMSASKEIGIEHTDVTINLLSSLGFVVNKEKSVSNLSQEIDFLMFLINSITMSLFLRRDKMKCIKRDCQQLLNNPTVPVWVLSVPIRFYSEKLSSSIQAAFLAPLHNHFLLKAKTVALRKCSARKPSYLWISLLIKS